MKPKCKHCKKILNLERKRGRPASFCDNFCRHKYQKKWHANYDAQPEQLKRRRDYMKGLRDA